MVVRNTKKWRSLDSVPVCLPRAPESIANGPYMCLLSYLCCGSPHNSTWARRYTIFAPKSPQNQGSGSFWEPPQRHRFAKIWVWILISLVPHRAPRECPEHFSYTIYGYLWCFFIKNNIFSMGGRLWLSLATCTLETLLCHRPSRIWSNIENSQFWEFKTIIPITLEVSEWCSLHVWSYFL